MKNTKNLFFALLNKDSWHTGKKSSNSVLLISVTGITGKSKPPNRLRFIFLGKRSTPSSGGIDEIDEVRNMVDANKTITASDKNRVLVHGEALRQEGYLDLVSALGLDACLRSD
ncbi:hypothetical protein F2Q70_00044141 [Brassica cretica]|uniref:Uncharacterized protein n=1 Tax=Brassica cretica TaxID=69181 RepID=A0A8S9KLT4_BRACR|nr:hypothetical protein F2Q70_00044141 [Brassica cretica]